MFMRSLAIASIVLASFATSAASQPSQQFTLACLGRTENPDGSSGPLIRVIRVDLEAGQYCIENNERCALVSNIARVDDNIITLQDERSDGGRFSLEIVRKLFRYEGSYIEMLSTQRDNQPVRITSGTARCTVGPARPLPRRLF